jgi:hypothetical protein
MNYNNIGLAASLLLSFTTVTAEASLTAGSVDGIDFVHSSVSGITWTGDANLLTTLENTLGYGTVVNAIMAASPTVEYAFFQDSGVHTLSSSDFASNGTVSWFGAKAFTHYLSSINYAGSNQWTLPSTIQFSELIINELGGTGYNNVPDTGNFTSEQSVYWSSNTEGPSYSWPYSPLTYHLNYYSAAANVWAVTTCDITAVPIPGASWLFASGLMGLAGWKRNSIGNVRLRPDLKFTRG